MARFVWMAALIAFGLLACDDIAQPCFTPQSVISDARVLAVRVDPPESVVDLQSDEGPTVALALLVVGAQADQYGELSTGFEIANAEVSISVCTLPTGLQQDPVQECPAEAQVLAGQSVVPTLVAPLQLTVPLALLRQALQEDPLRGAVGLQLRLQISVHVGDKTLVAFKTLYFQQAGSNLTPNHAIELTGVRVTASTSSRDFGAQESAQVVVAEPFGLRPLLGVGAGAAAPIEEYDTVDLRGERVHLREQVTYAFYASSSLFIGRVDYTRSLGNPTAIYTGLPGDVANEPAPGDTEPTNGLVAATAVWPGNQSGLVWIVASDGRGAQTWFTLRYQASEQRPACEGPPPKKGCPRLLFGCG
ncbi:MAG: hypothetical protein JST92_12130 [Deltaproteobacteria bacterium]|nr:hypothetical protein [Deltaproteobacteria bacterium]